MSARYPLRNTLYREAPRMEQDRMSGATAQKMRRAGGNAKSGRGSEEDGNGVRVGQRMSPTLAPQQPALSPAKSASSQAPTTPSSEQETSSEGELSSSCGDERNLRVGTMNKTPYNRKASPLIRRLWEPDFRGELGEAILKLTQILHIIKGEGGT